MNHTETDLYFSKIDIGKITPNPANPRKLFSGQKFDELVHSVKQKGVIEPIIVRHVNGSGGYEIVAGERRYRASLEAGLTFIPALVRDLTDDEAFDLMTIENLQRQDLTAYEEALGFKTYIDTKGEDAIPVLAERTSIDPRYIRRRVSVMALPDRVLAAWQHGYILYGHCEQLLRLPEDERLEYFEVYLNPSAKKANTYWGERPCSVAELKRRIDGKAIALKHALFSTKDAGCRQCVHNSTIQAQLFGDDLSEAKARCNYPACFREKQHAHLTATWPAGYDLPTNGCRFYDTADYNSWHSIWKAADKCNQCPSFVTLLNVTGEIHNRLTCVGDVGCYNDLYNKKSQPAKETVQRNHGEEFRELLYQRLIPSLAADLPNDDAKQLRITLAVILHGNYAARERFAKAHMKLKKKAGHLCPPVEQCWPVIQDMDPPALWDAIRGAVVVIVGQHDFGHLTRHLVAAHLGVDLTRDWVITEDYLARKTISELIALGTELGILTDPKAAEFRDRVIGARKFESMRKKDLIRTFLESGVDLAGKVPREILDINTR